MNIWSILEIVSLECDSIIYNFTLSSSIVEISCLGRAKEVNWRHKSEPVNQDLPHFVSPSEGVETATTSSSLTYKILYLMRLLCSKQRYCNPSDHLNMKRTSFGVGESVLATAKNSFLYQPPLNAP